MRVLIVDDDDAGRYLVSTIVSAEGHEAIEAVNGEDALVKARELPPDVVISDILMPVMDGYQLAREWKTDPSLVSIPLIFLTASYTDPADEKFAIELGADGFLSKPFDADALLAIVNDVVAAAEVEAPQRPLERTDVEVLEHYSQRVVHKLEQKLDELQRANTMLESAMEALSDEAKVKLGLLEELSEAVQQGEEREAELRSERDFTRSVLETAEVFIVATDLEGRVTLFSPGAERISGYSADEVLGRKEIELFAPGDAVDRRRGLDRALFESGSRQTLTNTWVMSSGEMRIFDWSSTILRNAEGEATGIIRFGIDATERAMVTRTERVLAVIDFAVLLDRPESEIVELTCAQTADEFALAAVYVALLAEDGTVSVSCVAGDAAPALAPAFEAEPNSACPVGSLDDLVATACFESGDDGLPEAWTRMAEQRGMKSAALSPVRAHGAVLGIVGAVSYSAHAFPQAVAHALQSIADRLGVAFLYSQAREQVALQSAALESAANAIVIADLSGHVLWANSEFESMTGYPVSEVVGTELFVGRTGYREPAYQDGWLRLRSGHSWRGEVVNTRRDGAEYHESVSIAPVRNESGDVTHGVIVKQDISDRVRFEQLKSDFVAMVSHELRTPLTTIIGYADLLAAGVGDLDSENLLGAADGIQTSGRKMKHIVEQLLEVSEIQAEGVRIDTAPLDVGHLVREVVEGVELTDQHVLDLDIPGELEPLNVDARRISRAVLNVVENAVKYSPDGGTVRVALRDDGDEVVISISDEGVGMSAEELPRLFEAFHQQDMSSTRSFGGIGMGLFVAYQFVSAHGGSITVQSREREGSTFEIRLPRADGAIPGS